MRVHLTFQQDDIEVDEFFNGATADEIVGKMKVRLSKEVGFVIRMALNAMNSLTFAQETVKRYNQAKKRNVPLPNTCMDFLKSMQTEGVVTIENEGL